MYSNSLAGLRILVLEDEFLIAMDVEQLCRDHGATDVVIMRSVDEVAAETLTRDSFGAAIVDVMLNGTSTLPLAKQIQELGIPFVFASGYTERDDIFTQFPGIALIGKPYSGNDLVEAVATAARRNV